MNATQFWTWFQENQENLYILPLLSTNEQEEYNHRLQTNLDYYWDGITFEIKFSENYTTPATLILYSNADPDIQMEAKTLVENAPLIDNWNVVTYNRKKEDLSEGKTVGPPNFKLHINQLYFQPILKTNKDSKITLNIFTTKDISYAKRKQFKKLCIQIMEDMVGEVLFNKHIKFIRCHLKTELPGVAIQFIHFPQFINNLIRLN
jgi:hypothetical protein